VDERRFSILLEEDVPVDPRKYGAVVAPALGLTVLEAKIAVRKGRGIFLERIAEEHARSIAAELEKDGIRCRAIPSDEIPVLPLPRKALSLEHGEDFLTYTPVGAEAKEHLPWDAVAAASCGVVAQPEYRELFKNVPFEMMPPMHKLGGGEREVVRENLILKMNAPPRADLKRRRPESIFEETEQKWGAKVKVTLDLVTADLATWLRVPMDEVAYQYMAGGVRMGGAWGFHLLVHDLREKAAPALSGMTLKLLDATDIKELVFVQVEEFTRYTAWCALRRVLWPNADSSSPSPAPPASPTDAASSTSSPEAGPASTSS
jgi:hypothetical protein